MGDRDQDFLEHGYFSESSVCDLDLRLQTNFNMGRGFDKAQYKKATINQIYL